MPSGQELAQYYVQIIPSAKGIGGKIVSAIDEEDPGGKAGKSIGESLKKAIVGIGIGKVVLDVFKTAIAEGSKLEQSVGGIEQIFGDGSAATEALKKNAQEAFAYAQVSANDYMQQVTQFSARLMQGLGGDTEATVKYADMAIRQMSDNANTFGTDISSLQNAYQGFAKGNFTMLDNLRLGYGGTASEMARLINDSGVMGKSFVATAKNINKVSFDKIIEAIQVVQDNMKITGKTSLEAASTLEGSANAMKSSFKNLMADLAMGEDAQTALTGVVTYGVAYATNLGKAVINVVKSLPPAIVGAMQQLWPTVQENGSNLISKFMEGVDGWMSKVIKTGGDIISKILQGIVKALPNVVKIATQVIGKLATTITSHLPEIVETGKDLILNFLKGLADKMPSVVDSIKDMVKNVWETVKSVDWLAVGKNLLTLIWEGIKIIVPTVISTIGSLGSSMVKKLKEVDWLKLGKDVIQFIINGIKNMITAILNTVGNLAKDMVKKITDTDWFKAGKDIIDSIKNGITNKASNLWEKCKEVGQKIKGNLNGQDWYGIGVDMMNGLTNGINAGSSRVSNAAGAAASAAANRARNVMRIASPSKVFEEIGEYMDLGLAKGISENIRPIETAMDGLLNTVDTAVDLALSPNDFRANDSANHSAMNYNYGGVNINVYGHTGQSALDIANEVSNILSEQVIRRREVFG